MLANTEWLPDSSWNKPFSDPEYPQRFSWDIEPQTDDRKNSRTRMVRWFYALNGAKTMLDYINTGGEFILANFNNCCNTWGGNVIESAKEAAWLSPAGLMMGFFPGVEGMFPLKTEISNDSDGLVTTAALEGGGQQWIFFLNRSDEEKQIEIDFADANDIKFSSGEVLHADDPLARTRKDGSDIKKKEADVINNTVRLPKYSLTKLIYK